MTTKSKWEEVAEKSKDLEKEAQEKKEAQKQETTEANKIEELTKDACEAKLLVVEKERDDYLNKFTRALADIKNIQSRAERDLANSHKYAIEKFAFELLAVVDNLERTLEIKVDESDIVKNIHLGVELTLKSLMETLQKFGVTQVNPIKENFNPMLHSAISVKEDTTVAPNTVVQVVQKGYLLKDKVIRPAMVIVSK